MPNVNIHVITTYAFIVAHLVTLSALTQQEGAGKHNIIKNRFVPLKKQENENVRVTNLVMAPINQLLLQRDSQF